MLLAVSGAILGIVLAFGWRDYKEPLAGGGRPDSFFTRWAKNRAYSIVPAAEERAATRLTLENGNGWFNLSAEPVQSLALYQSQNPTRPTNARRTLVLQPLGAMTAQNQALIRDCKTYCEAFFGLPARIAPPILWNKTQISTRPAVFGSSKLQLNSGELLNRVLSPNLPGDAAAYLGITEEDLWTEGLSFVFGQATFHERVGVYSLARYFPKNRAQKPTLAERSMALRRTAQVLTHEAGHMFGLSHCVLYHCTMNGSNSLADSDASPLDFCPICERKLAWNIGFDTPRRAAQLKRIRKRFGLDK